MATSDKFHLAFGKIIFSILHVYITLWVYIRQEGDPVKMENVTKRGVVKR